MQWIIIGGICEISLWVTSKVGDFLQFWVFLSSRERLNNFLRALFRFFSFGSFINEGGEKFFQFWVGVKWDQGSDWLSCVNVITYSPRAWTLSSQRPGHLILCVATQIGHDYLAKEPCHPEMEGGEKEMTMNAPTKKTGPPNPHRFINKTNKTKKFRVKIHPIWSRTDTWLCLGLG